MAKMIPSNLELTNATLSERKVFNALKTQNQATSITFNNGKTAYVVTGDEYKQIESLYDDMASSVDIASNTYGKGNPMVKLVMESEMDRFTDLAKMIVVRQEDSTFEVSYDDLTNRITSIDLIM